MYQGVYQGVYQGLPFSAFAFLSFCFLQRQLGSLLRVSQRLSAFFFSQFSAFLSVFSVFSVSAFLLFLAWFMPGFSLASAWLRPGYMRTLTLTLTLTLKMDNDADADADADTPKEALPPRASPPIPLTLSPSEKRTAKSVRKQSS